MSTQTTNFHLIKPELSDPADITALNTNLDTIDTTLKSLSNYVKARAKFVADTYVGNGGDTVLTFNFKPWVIFITALGDTHIESVVIYGQNKTIASSGSGSDGLIDTIWENNVVTFYRLFHDETHIQHALSINGTTYQYVAIGV